MKFISKKVFVYLLIGVIYMFNFCGCSSGFKYENYSGKDPEINITLDYMPGWLHSEHRGAGDAYAQIIFYEPERKDKNFKAGIVITVKKGSMIKLTPLTIDAVADDLITKRLKLPDAKMDSKAKIRLLNTEAIAIGFSYNLLDKLYTVGSKSVPIKEKVIILNRDDRFYIFRYENTSGEFNKFNNAFEHMVKTVRFKKIKTSQ